MTHINVLSARANDVSYCCVEYMRLKSSVSIYYYYLHWYLDNARGSEGITRFIAMFKPISSCDRRRLSSSARVFALNRDGVVFLVFSIRSPAYKIIPTYDKVRVCCKQTTTHIVPTTLPTASRVFSKKRCIFIHLNYPCYLCVSSEK